uniref:Uncharacterized protein n=1 Tax=Romanomermis culicivorax TaxID=13658 RepID=A0A915JL20_ROMCU
MDEGKKKENTVCMEKQFFLNNDHKENCTRALFLTMINVDVLALTFWKEVLISFKSWWKSQRGELYLARRKPFWSFMKRLCPMLENPMLDDEQLASHLWNILPPVATNKDSGPGGHHCLMIKKDKKVFGPHSSDEEEIYEPVPIGCGGIHNAHQYLNHNNFLKDNYCIIQINNIDNI